MLENKNLEYSHKDFSFRVASVVRVSIDEMTIIITMPLKNSVYVGAKMVITDIDGNELSEARTITANEEMPSLTAGVSYSRISLDAAFDAKPAAKARIKIYWDLASRPTSDFSDSDIVGSIFSYQYPYGAVIPDGGARIFPDGIEDVRFLRCITDNVYIPPTCTTSDYQQAPHSRKILQECNNREVYKHHWSVPLGKYIPTRPIRRKEFIREGLSIEPEDIPAERVAKSPLRIKQDERHAARLAAYHADGGS